jgi:hypothetical protein
LIDSKQKRIFALPSKARGATSDVRYGSEADMCGAIAHVRFTSGSDLNSGHRGVQLRAEHFSLRPIRSNVDLLRNGEGVVYVDAKIPYSALYLGMAKQKLNGSQIPGSAVDERRFSPPQ